MENNGQQPTWTGMAWPVDQSVQDGVPGSPENVHGFPQSGRHTSAPTPSQPEARSNASAWRWGCGSLLAAPFLLVFFIAFVFGCYFLVRNTGYLTHGVHTTGTVVAVRDMDANESEPYRDIERHAFPTSAISNIGDDDPSEFGSGDHSVCGLIQYRAPAYRRTFTFASGLCSPHLKIGQTFPVVYRADRPGDAKQWGPGRMYALPFAVTLPYLLSVTGIGWLLLRRRRQAKAATAHADSSSGDAVPTWPTLSGTAPVTSAPSTPGSFMANLRRGPVRWDLSTPQPVTGRALAIFVFVISVATLVGVGITVHEVQVKRSTQTTLGVVEQVRTYVSSGSNDNKSRTYYCPTVSYQVEDVRHQRELDCSTKKRRQGDGVRMAYDPAQPDKARFERSTVGLVLSMTVWFACCLLPVVAVVRGRRRLV